MGTPPPAVGDPRGPFLADELLAAELAAEQTFVDRVYVQLERSARNARELAREGHARGGLGHEGGLVERDAMVYQAARRIAQLDAAHEGLVFGRLDLQHSLDRHPRYIGRIGLRDENRDSLLIDWRAPAAAVFYQATAAEPPRGIRRRGLRAAVRPAGRARRGGGGGGGGGRAALGRGGAGRGRAPPLPIIGEAALIAQL